MPKEAAHLLSRPGCACRRVDMQSYLKRHAPDLRACMAELERAHSFRCRLRAEGNLRLTPKFVEHIRREVRWKCSWLGIHLQPLPMAVHACPLCCWLDAACAMDAHYASESPHPACA
jgi:hypothetical protein